MLTLLLFAMKPLHAQMLKGTVGEAGSSDRIPGAFIRDINSTEVAVSDKKGNFELKTDSGHVLVFYSPGYVPDTLFLIDMKPKNVRLIMEGIVLREVNISAKKGFNPREEYADVYRKSKIYALSPSTWFSEEGRNARRLKKFFDREEQERHVDQVYTRAYVSSLVPLKGSELEDFMFMFRPTYAYITANNGPSLVVYVNDSYKKFMALPPEKRKMPRLVADTTQ